jgi:hypothetical protein
MNGNGLLSVATLKLNFSRFLNSFEPFNVTDINVSELILIDIGFVAFMHVFKVPKQTRILSCTYYTWQFPDLTFDKL